MTLWYDTVLHQSFIHLTMISSTPHQKNDPKYANVSFISFFVFIGTAMSITAFPVLARILKEGGLIYTTAGVIDSHLLMIVTVCGCVVFLFLAPDWSFPLSFPWFPGSMAMGAAALNDAAAWCLLVLAISLGINSVQHSNAKQKIYFYSCYRIILNVYLSWHVAANSANLNTAGFVFLSVVAFAVVLIVAFRPLWWQLVTYVENQNSPSMSNGLFCLTLILVFLCAWTTALIGLGERVSCSLFYSVTYCMDIVNSFFILPPSLIVYMSI